MTETKIKFVKRTTELTSTPNQRERYKKDTNKFNNSKREKQRLRDIISKGFGLEEAIKIAQESPKPTRSRFNKDEKFSKKPRNFSYKDNKFNNQAPKQERVSQEGKQDAAKEKDRSTFKKPGSGENRSFTKKPKGKRPSIKFGESRDASRDNFLLRDLQRKIEILKNANKLSDD